jgi:hypothetical protein
MRWKRGFFRLWVVISGLWIIGAVIIGWSSVADPRVHGRVVRLDPVTETHRITDAPVYYWSSTTPVAPQGFQTVLIELEGTRYGFQFPEGTVPNLGESDWVKSVVEDAHDDKQRRLQEKQIGNILTLLMAAILPPVTILAIGGAFAWAISGFSRKEDAGCAKG